MFWAIESRGRALWPIAICTRSAICVADTIGRSVGRPRTGRPRCLRGLRRKPADGAPCTRRTRRVGATRCKPVRRRVCRRSGRTRPPKRLRAPPGHRSPLALRYFDRVLRPVFETGSSRVRLYRVTRRGDPYPRSVGPNFPVGKILTRMRE